MKNSKKIAGTAVLAGVLGGAAVALGAGSALADRGPDIPFIPGPPSPGHLRHDFDGRHGHDDDVNVVVPVPQVPDVNVVVPTPPSVNVWLP